MSRKRLGRVNPDAVEAAREKAGQRSRTTAPIAQMAAGVGRTIDAEIQRLRDENAALAGKGAALDAAEAEGRMIRTLDLDEIDTGHIPRDRLGLDKAGEDWAALKDSIAARGQQVPIEVVDLGEGTRPRYGLITGLRRVTALTDLRNDTGEPGFGRVLALVRQAQSVPDKLIAMIEENEIRAGISFYERGRIAWLAAEAGIFPSADHAIDGLFARSNRNRRYKIRCFLTVHEVLGAHLRHADAIGERLGIALSKSLREGRVGDLIAALGALSDGGRHARVTQAAELQLLTDFTTGRGAFAKAPDKPDAKPASTAWNGPGDLKVAARTKGKQVVVEIDGLGPMDETGLNEIVGFLARRIMRAED